MGGRDDERKQIDTFKDDNNCLWTEWNILVCSCDAIETLAVAFLLRS